MSKFIRTENRIYQVESEYLDNEGKWVGYNIVENDMAIILRDQVIKKADTIEELIDNYVFIEKGEMPVDLDKDTIIFNKGLYIEDGTIIYGAIWTDKGLIYVAKMNEKGELELI